MKKSLATQAIIVLYIVYDFFPCSTQQPRLKSANILTNSTIIETHLQISALVISRSIVRMCINYAETIAPLELVENAATK